MGGLFRHVLDCLQYFTDAGISVGVVCDEAIGTQAPVSMREMIEKSCSLGLLGIPIPRRPSPCDIVSLLRTARYCKTVRPDIIHGHGAKGGFYSRIVSRMTGVPSIYTPHGGVLHLSSWPLLIAERMLSHMSGGLIFESEYAKRMYERKMGNLKCPNRIIYNGVSQDDLRPVTGTPDFDFVYVGELRYLKGVDVLLDASRILLDRGHRFRIGVFGLGKMEHELRRRAEELGLDERTLSWEGPVDCGRDAMARGRCVIVPSRKESMPYVVLEALAMKIGLIATNVGGISEIYGRKCKKDLIPPGDPIPLAEVMGRFLEESEFRTKEKDVLYERITRLFRAERMASSILGFYEKVASSGSKPGDMS